MTSTGSSSASATGTSPCMLSFAQQDPSWVAWCRSSLTPMQPGWEEYPTQTGLT